MGSIVGGLYSCGYSVDSLIKIAREVDWITLFSNKIDRRDLSIGEKEASERYLISIPSRNFKLQFPTGLTSGQGVSEWLCELMWPYLGTTHFDQLPIPFLCVATNIEEGNSVILDSGYLPDAVRASISVPTLFTPVLIDSMYLVDGGVSDNLPVRALKSKGVDIIIGVSLSPHATSRLDPGNIGKIMFQTSFVQSRNIRKMNEELCDILICPDVNKYSMMSYKDADSLIIKGELAARTHIKELKALVSDINKSNKNTFTSNTNLPFEYYINTIEFQGSDNLNEEMLKNILKLNIPGKINSEMMKRAVNRAYGSQLFSKITYKIESKGQENKLLIIAHKTPPQLFQIGAHYNSDFQAAIYFNFTQRNILFKESKFSVEGIASSLLHYKLEYIISGRWQDKNMYRKSPIYNVPDIGISFAYQAFSPYIYDSIGNRVKSFHYVQRNPRLYITKKTGTNLNATLGTEFQDAWTEANVIYDHVKPVTHIASLYASLYFDSFNDNWYPTTGAKFFSQIKYGSALGNNPNTFTHYYFSFKFARKIVSGLTLITHLYNASIQGVDIPWDNLFLLGGMNNSRVNISTIPFLGYDLFEVSTRNTAVLRTDFQWNFSGNHYLITKFNLGRNSEQFENIFTAKDFLLGGAVTYGHKSLIGPIEITVLKARNREFKSYLSIGFWF